MANDFFPSLYAYQMKDKIHRQIIETVGLLSGLVCAVTRVSEIYQKMSRMSY